MYLCSRFQQRLYSLVELTTPQIFMDKTNVTKRVTATILSMSLLTVMAGAAIAPALGIIKAHFSQANDLLVQLIVSMPALLIIVTNFFFLSISRCLRTRAIATTGLLLYVTAGAGCFFVNDIHVLLVPCLASASDSSCHSLLGCWPTTSLQRNRRG